jgi:predicted DNA-binding transcriptional regulator AlpA
VLSPVKSGQPPRPVPDRLINSRQVCHRLQISKRTLYRKLAQDLIPPPFERRRGLVMTRRESVIEAYLSSPRSRGLARAYSALALLLGSEGYLKGFPVHVTTRTRMIDMASVRRRKCGGCRARAMQLEPYHKEGRYRALAHCQACGAGEEV